MKNTISTLIFLIIAVGLSGQDFDLRLVINIEASPNTLTVEIRKSTPVDVAENTRLFGLGFNFSSGGDFISGTSSVSGIVPLVYDQTLDVVSNDPSAGSILLPALVSGQWLAISALELNEGQYMANQFVVNPTTTDFDNAAFINIGSFSDQFLNVQSSVLPVELFYFTASKRDLTSVLNWETVSEINNDFFDIERSADGRSFQKIGKIQGNGTTTETQNYEFIDREPLAGINYYRLKQHDYNGDYEYSNVETVDFRDGTEGDVTIFPNPAADYVNVSLDRSYDGIRITNQLGQLVEVLPAQDYESNQFKLDLSGYAPGVYFLEAKVGLEIVNKQFVKVK